MATLNSISAGPLDTRAMDFDPLSGGVITEQSPTHMVVGMVGGVQFGFTGVGLTYDNLGHPLSGAIINFDEVDNGQLDYYVWNINVSVTDFFNWAQSADHQALVSNLLGGDDVITGSPRDDYLEGYSGHDAIYGGVGSDTLIGGDGNDHLYGIDQHGGADGPDSLTGGNGSDYLQGNAGNDTLEGGLGSDRINGGQDNDLIFSDDGNDRVNGNLGADTIDGGAGNDTLRGGQGDDTVNGGSGDDVIMGDLGNDTLSGGLGDDTMTGGPGADIFKFEGDLLTAYTNHADVVTDYESAIDHLSIGRIPGPVHDYGVSTDQTAALKVTATTILTNSGHGSDIAVFHENGDTYVLWEAPGSLTFDTAVILRGEHTITPADFV